MSQISPLMFSSSKKELFSWTYLLKKTPRRTKILISPVWNKILKIWDTHLELIQIEVQCSKNYFKIYLPQEAGAFGNNIKKEPQKPRPNFKKYFYYIFTHNICYPCNPMRVVVFSQKGINFVERLKFPHFEGSIIPQTFFCEFLCTYPKKLEKCLASVTNFKETLKIKLFKWKCLLICIRNKTQIA